MGNKYVPKEPFLQRRFITHVKQQVEFLSCSMDQTDIEKELAKIVQQLVILERDDASAMTKCLPTAYYNIYIPYFKGPVGKTSDPDGVLEEEPNSTFVEISLEEFERDDE